MSITRTIRRGVAGAVTAAAVLGGAAGAQAADDVVLHSTSTTTYGKLGTLITETWSDEATGDALARHSDAAGTPDAASLVDYPAAGTAGEVKLRWVSFRSRGVYDESSPFDGRAPESTAAALRRWHASGAMVAVGHEQVGGRRALVLATAERDRQHQERFWVDEATFLPLRSEARGRFDVRTTTYEALPRTSENLAKVSLDAPSGFRRLATVPQTFAAIYAARGAKAARAKAKVLSNRRRAGKRARRASRRAGSSRRGR